jgi:hypothetical protein
VDTGSIHRGAVPDSSTAGEGFVTDLDAKEEARERKRMDSIWWAGALIWIGLTLAAEYLDILPEVGDATEWWPWIFLGVGPWSLALNLYRQSSGWPNPSTWDWIWTAIFLAAGLGTIVDIGGELVGAGVLIVIGIVIMVRALSPNE